MPSLPIDVLIVSDRVDHRGRDCKSPKWGDRDDIVAVTPQSGPRRAGRSVFLAFRNGPARQTDLGEYGRIVTERLVHVWNDLDHLAEQRALAIIDHFGDEVRADRLPVGVELDLAVGRIDLELRKRFLELGLVVAEIAINLPERQNERHGRSIIV